MLGRLYPQYLGTSWSSPWGHSRLIYAAKRNLLEIVPLILPLIPPDCRESCRYSLTAQKGAHKTGTGNGQPPHPERARRVRDIKWIPGLTEDTRTFART